MELRDYQVRDVEKIRQAYQEGYRRILYVAPTGSGKTVLFGFIALSAMQKKRTTCILAHRRELVKQTAEKILAWDIKAKTIMGNTDYSNSLVSVASIQTLARRLKNYSFDFLIEDEAHHSVSSTYQSIHAAYPEAKILGVTATPLRLDGRGLIESYDKMIIGPSIQELIDQGYLCRPRVFAPSTPDMTGIKNIGGDFDKNTTELLMDKPSITGDAIAHYLKHCPGERALAFCVSVKHAKDVAYQFTANGIKSESIDGSMSDGERAWRLDALASGKLKVLTSCELIGEGLDIPAVTAVIMLRPTLSLSVYLQQIGRALRPADNKPYAIILDHAGNTHRHGLPTEPREWTLEGRPKGKRRSQLRDGPEIRQCPKCFYVHEPQPICPNCNHAYQIKERKIKQIEGELVELSRSSFKTERAKRRSFEDLQKFAKAKGYKPGWAWRVYNARKRKRAAKTNPLGSL
ncbi:MAG: DEAD/DEAH box helicase [Candidatus Babeliales bacterium]